MIANIPKLRVAREEIMDSIERLLSLPNDTLIYPGHMEMTDIGRERATNLFPLEL